MKGIHISLVDLEEENILYFSLVTVTNCPVYCGYFLRAICYPWDECSIKKKKLQITNIDITNLEQVSMYILKDNHLWFISILHSHLVKLDTAIFGYWHIHFSRTNVSSLPYETNSSPMKLIQHNKTARYSHHNILQVKPCATMPEIQTILELICVFV